MLHCFFRKHTVNYLSIVFLFLFFPGHAQKGDWNIPFESVANDPMGVRIYTLENGLRIYLSSYKNAPRIQTYIAVNTGSKNDPSNATGLAHYLEHIMFKGTSRFGTMNWAKEKVYLDRIEQLFEQHRASKDEMVRKQLYKKIDSLSLIASTYAIANEYDKMLSQLGASGTNAYTWVDQTVYVNDIPANQIARWAKIEAERFSTIVPRLFHTELEAVYEEKNKGLDNDGRKVWESLFEGLFPDHPYGTQTTIGTVEHLKSPSITEIKKYFNTYYKPNNMAICMSGDLNYDSTVLILQQYFGTLSPGEIPIKTISAQTLKGPLKKVVAGPTSESMTMAYRIDEPLQKDPMLQARLKILSALLYNGQAGLIDLKLNQAQKIQSGYAYDVNMHDYSLIILGAQPVNGSNLETCEKLLLSEVENLKQGKFEPWLIEAVVADYKKTLTRELEHNKNRANKMVEAFVLGLPWENQVNQISYMEKTTASDVVSWAKQYLNTENLVVVFKKQGIDSSIQKVSKPSISAVTLNRDTTSAFYKQVFQLKTPAIEPVFLDFSKDLNVIDSTSNLPIVYKQNSENNLFTLQYSWNITKEHDTKYSLLMKYLSYLGSSQYKANELNNAFYKIGCEYKFSSSNDNLVISLSGLDENMGKAIALLEGLLTAPQPDLNALQNIKQNILKVRIDQKTSREVILKSGLVNYAMYGSSSPFTDIISEDELKKISSSELLTLLKQLRNTRHKVLYYGPQSSSELKKIIETHHKAGTQNIPPPSKKYTFTSPVSNQVYWVNYDMVQAEIMILHQSSLYDYKTAVASFLFNEYFGGSMSSLVFQEIRESKALAYAVKSNYAVAQRLNEPNYQISYIGTQADKIHEALDAMLGLLKEFPYSETLFNNAIASIKESIVSERIDRMSVISTYEKSKRMGIDHDLRKDIYAKLNNSNYEDLLKFHADYIKNKPHTILVIGSKDKIDFTSLEKYGKVKELSLKELFGY